jgi:acid phosphatase family membrane protein YuiD
MPSTHTAVVSTTAALIGLREGIHTAVFSLAAPLAMIVLLEATHVRREMGAHAAALHALGKAHPARWQFREHLGHRQIEVLSGLLVGLVCALVLSAASP